MQASVAAAALVHRGAVLALDAAHVLVHGEVGRVLVLTDHVQLGSRRREVRGQRLRRDEQSGDAPARLEECLVGDVGMCLHAAAEQLEPLRVEAALRRVDVFDLHGRERA